MRWNRRLVCAETTTSHRAWRTVDKGHGPEGTATQGTASSAPRPTEPTRASCASCSPRVASSSPGRRRPPCSRRAPSPGWRHRPPGPMGEHPGPSGRQVRVGPACRDQCAWTGDVHRGRHWDQRLRVPLALLVATGFVIATATGLVVAWRAASAASVAKRIEQERRHGELDHGTRWLVRPGDRSLPRCPTESSSSTVRSPASPAECHAPGRCVLSVSSERPECRRGRGRPASDRRWS